MWQVNSEFQAFKHIEVLGPGELQRASEPLEATLAIHPTLILTNALPYYMEVIVWQVSPPCRCTFLHIAACILPEICQAQQVAALAWLGNAAVDATTLI